MRILRNSLSFPILALNFASIAARVGFIAASWLLLMDRFHVSPILSGIMSCAVQGFVTVMTPISRSIFSRVSLLTSQRIGAVLGLILSLTLIFVNDLIAFVLLVFVASFSKVAIESTFPRVTHAFLSSDPKFSAKLMGTQQSSVLFVSALIAPIALMGFHTAPMAIAAILYSVALGVTFVLSKCGDDGYTHIVTTHDSQVVFNRRFSDIKRNEEIRERQSRIHKFRRISSTLLMMDLFAQILGGGSVIMTPLVFKEVSHVSQGMDSTLCFVFGVFASLTGFVFFPLARKAITKSASREWIVLTCSVSLSLFTCVLYTTYFGVSVGVVAAVINGCVAITTQTMIHHIAARDMEQMQYQKFGCTLMQRNAIARVATPISLGVFAAITSIYSALMLLTFVSVVFTVIMGIRVSLIIHGRRFDHRTLRSIEDSAHPARKLRTSRRSRSDVSVEDARATFELVGRRHFQQITKIGPHHWIRIRSLSKRSTPSFPQEDSLVNATRWSSR